MDTASIATILDSKPRGSFYTLIVKRAGHVRKGVTQVIEKVSTMQGQITDYANRKAVREAVAEGERDAPELPKHVKESIFVGKTRFWVGETGQEYLPVCLGGNASTTQWLLDGVEVDADAVKDYLLASEFPKPRATKEEMAEKGQVPFCSIKVENVVEIH